MFGVSKEGPDCVTVEWPQEGPLNKRLSITAEFVGAGGAHTFYTISGNDSPLIRPVLLAFQQGDPATEGINGWSNEALLAIVIHRLKGFQQGPFKNDFNAFALHAAETALATLNARSVERGARGVSGKQVP